MNERAEAIQTFSQQIVTVVTTIEAQDKDGLYFPIEPCRDTAIILALALVPGGCKTPIDLNWTFASVRYVAPESFELGIDLVLSALLKSFLHFTEARAV